jgi:hypothetical protein
MSFKFLEIDIAEAKPLIDRWHYAPGPSSADYCFGAVLEKDLIAVCVFNKLINPQHFDILEFIAHGKKPGINMQMSQLIKYCCKQLKYRNKHLLVTFCEAERGNGAVFRGSTWNYDGRRAWTKSEYRLEGEMLPEGRYHVYWKALTDFGEIYAKNVGLRSLPYLKNHPFYRISRA